MGRSERPVPSAEFRADRDGSVVLAAAARIADQDYRPLDDVPQLGSGSVVFGCRCDNTSAQVYDRFFPSSPEGDEGKALTVQGNMEFDG